MNSTSTRHPLREQFVFNCDHLLQFCTKFNSSPVKHQTDSILDVKLKDLESRWTEVETSYKKVMLTSEDTISSEFKQEARTNFDACMDGYYHSTSQIMNLMKVSRLGAPDSLTFTYTSITNPNANKFWQLH